MRPNQGQPALTGTVFAPLAAAHAPPLRLEELRDVLPLPECRRMAGAVTVIEVRLIVRRPHNPPNDPSRTPEPRVPFPVSRPPFSLPSHIPSPHTAPRAPWPSCDATRPATIRGRT